MKASYAVLPAPTFAGAINSAPIVWCGALTLLLIFGQALPTISFFSTPAHYLPFHSVLELLSIVVSGMVFGLSWSLRSQDNNNQRMLIGSGFLAVCLIDAAHTLSFAGMPDFITPSNTEKAINFWLAGRYVAALTLLAVAFLPLRRWPAWACLGTVVSAVLIALGVIWAETVHGNWLPRTFVAGQGLTSFKLGAEYLVAALYAVAALGFYLQGKRTHNPDKLWLAAAAWIQGLAEMFFTLYADVSDIFNLLGHVYKAISYLMIYKAVFATGVLAPYRELIYERSWLQTLLACIPDPVWLKDANGVYVARNQAYVEKFVKDHMEVLGKTDDEFFGKESAEEFRSNDRHVMMTRQPLRTEENVQTSNGECIVVDTTKTPMYLPNGELIGVLGIAHDITEKIATEQALRNYRDHLETLVAERTQALTAALAQAEAANKAKSTFLSNMSHELRTPLNSVIGFSRLMARSENLSATERKNLEIINRSGNHLLMLINDVLELSKIEAGHVGLAQDTTDITELAREVADMLKLRAEQNGLLLTLELANLPPAVRVDSVKLRQILINLLTNAIKFTRQGSLTLSVKGRPHGGNFPPVEFSIIDTGIGIAEEDRQKIFEPFVQIVTHATTAGTGLGLTITRQYLHMLGSELVVESTLGAGSCFRFLLQLPLATTRPLPVPATVNPPPGDGESTGQGADVLNAIPQQLRNELCQAVEELNPAKIKVTLQQLEMIDPQVAAVLARMARDFQYRELQGLLYCAK